MNQSTLRNALVILWNTHGEPDGQEKTSAAMYFYGLRQESLNRDALGSDFCKVASRLKSDPWTLALSVCQNLPALEQFSKTASNKKAHELTEFYVNWADGVVKRAAPLGGLVRGAKKMIGGAKNLIAKKAPKAYVDPAFPRLPSALQQAPAAPTRAMPKTAPTARPAVQAPPPRPVQAAPAAPVHPAGQPRPLPEPAAQAAQPASQPRAPGKAERKQLIAQHQAQQQAHAGRAEAQRAASAAKTEPGRAAPKGGQKQLKKDILARRTEQYGRPAVKEQLKGVQKAQAGRPGGPTTLGHKLLGGAAIGLPAYGAMQAFGGGGEEMAAQPQYGYQQGY